MFLIKRMSAEDFEFAVRLTDTQDWNLVEEDFKFMMELEPEGCFVLLDNSERVGIITSISFGKLGWFGNLIVDEKCRKKGAGASLVKHVINYLSRKNVEVVGLYAYMHTIPFYEKLGFKRDSDFIVLEGKAFSSPANARPKEVGKKDFQKIINYDLYCFGASRKKLLEAILRNVNNMGYYFAENGQMLGYIMAKVYEGVAEIGPLVCQQERSDVAINLIKTVLNRLESFEVSFCVLEKESAILNFLTKSGISQRFRVARMFLKPFSTKNCVYMAESLERG